MNRHDRRKAEHQKQQTTRAKKREVTKVMAEILQLADEHQRLHDRAEASRGGGTTPEEEEFRINSFLMSMASPFKRRTG